MNLSMLLTKIKVNLGLYAIALPLDNPDEFMTQIIQDITRRTFSNYAPLIETYRFDTNSMEKLEKIANYESYLLPDIFSNREILYVKDAYYDQADLSGIGYWGGALPVMRGNMLNQTMLSNAGMHLTNKLIPRLTFKYEHPRKITFYNLFSSSKVVLEIAFIHDKNLASIKPTQEESFFELAVLDIKDALYQILKHYSDIQSAYGNINLKLDDWAQAADQRRQLIENWDNTYHMDIFPFIYA